MKRRFQSFTAVLISFALLFSYVCTTNASSQADYIPLSANGSSDEDFEIEVDFTSVGDTVNGVNIKAVYDTDLLECVGVDYSEKVQNGMYDDVVDANDYQAIINKAIE